jgi:uncharacterized phage protein gp47/JayE
MSGLSVTGFDAKRLADIKTDIEDALKAAFNDNIDLSAQSVFGQLIGIIAEVIADQWESEEDVYNSQYPSTASSNQLSNVVAYNGLVRKPATKTVVPEVAIIGVPGTFVPAGSQASMSSTGAVFESDTDATISGIGIVVVSFTAVETGPTSVGVNDIDTIETPIFGWEGVSNAITDIAVGQDEETDQELRLRRTVSVAFPSQNLTASLFSQLLALDGVNDVFVQENKTTATIGGIPPHQFETIVDGGDDDEIANLVWNNTPQGIDSHGDELVVITDIQGFTQNVNFTRPTNINIYFDLTIVTDPAAFPASGVSDIKDAIVTHGESNFKIGDDVIYSSFFTPINSVPGVLSIDLKMGKTPSPTGTSNIAMLFSEISRYSSANVAVGVS